MEDKDKLKEEYEIGYSIFKKLFKLNDTLLKEKIISICDEKYNEIVNNSSNVKRIIINEKPRSIEIEYYDSIIVDYSGIQHKPECGYSNYIVKFNKHFTLEEIKIEDIKREEYLESLKIVEEYNQKNN